MDSSPDGYVAPFPVHLVELTDESGDACYGQVAGFTSREEAERLVSRLAAEGRLARINDVPIHTRWIDYEYDR